MHLLNGLYDAKLDGQPVLAVVGQQARTALGSSYQQELDLTSLFKDVAGDYLQMVTVPEQVPNVVDRAIRIAVARRTVTCLVVPNDVQNLAAVERVDLPKEHGVVPGGGALGGSVDGLPRPTTCATPPTCSTGRSGSPSSSVRGRVERPIVSSGSPTCSVPGSPRRCSARTCFPTTCRS